MYKRRKKIMLVFGTRPEAIKMCPVIRELYHRDIAEVRVCVTGQHREMLDQVLKVFDIVPDYDLHIMRNQQTLFDITSDVLTQMAGVLKKENPDIVLVHGDTTTTFATALASFYLKIKVCHIEAGLRTQNIYSPYPEEFNRQAVSLISVINFAPTDDARMNLLRENRSEKTIFVTGNTAIDALKWTVSPSYKHPILDWVGDSRLVLLTAHRRENLGDHMQEMFSAIRQVLTEYPDVKVVYPVHKNPQIRSLAESLFNGLSQIKLVEPLGVIDFHNLMARSYLILTDSGGIQEEAPSLGIPVLVMRDTTERPEGVKAGTLKLVGTARESIYDNFKLLLTDKNVYKSMSTASNPYGDGFASKRIVDVLKRFLDESYFD